MALESLKVEKLLLTELYSQSNYIKIIALNQIILILSRSFKALRTKKGTEGNIHKRETIKYEQIPDAKRSNVRG